MEWPSDWLATATSRKRELWRGVEAQHRVATMKLADSLADQEVLERLLEDSKPPLPRDAARTHYLLFTPFRYASPWPSRFRRPNEPGAWYGADEPATVAAEIAFWRWRFFMDSDGVRNEQLVTEHTFFLARFSGLELDITQDPWMQNRDAWRHPGDYAQCHALAAQARTATPPVQGIRYESARRAGGLCEVVFDVRTLSLPRPQQQQTWTCKTTRSRVLLSHDDVRMQFEMSES